MWYNGAGRSIASANYGTNNNVGVPTRPATVPASTDNVPVTLTRYDIRGQVFETVDPVGSVRRTDFDGAGRVIKTIENFGGTETQTVRMEYNAAGQMSKQIAENVETGDQETVYTYGVVMSGSNSSDLASNQLLQSVTWPDGGVTSYRYNRAGQQTAVSDPNGTIHEFIYDEFGRRITDKVTTLGSGVDGGVRRVEYSYGNRERIQKLTNFDAVTGGNVQSEILYQYSDFGQIVREYQQHGDEVDTLTTPYVEYNYADGTSNTIRLLSLEYPNGRTLTYGYGTSGSLTDRTGRVSTISEGEGATTLVTYSYLGGGQLVTRHYNQPVIERSIVTGSGSNPYAALDRFGRLIDLKWIKDSKSGKVDIVRFEYGYDRVSNRLFERNTVLAGSPAVNPGVDSLFGYDQLNRLTQCETGVLNTGGTAISSPQTAQDWVLDETGNFIEFTQQNLQSGVLTTTLDQTRDHNAVNEITGIDETVGASWATPAHDNSGNMTSIPQPKALTSNFTATWDAWNRLVSLSDGSNLVAEYKYDPINRLILVTNYDFSSEPETVEVRHRYHTTNWQVIEERIGSSATAAQQFVWNVGYIDDLLLRDRDTNGDGSLDERLYALTDLRYSVMALANTSGTIVERFRYEAHGRSTALNADFVPRVESFYDWEYRYTGRELDLQTCLYYFRNRYYHADLGRFISRDPLVYVDGMSRYKSYLSSSGTDPSGLTIRFSLTYWRTIDIFNRFQGTHLAFTGGKPEKTNSVLNPDTWTAPAANIQEEGDDSIGESCDGYCAWVNRAKILAVDVYMILPIDATLSEFFDLNGFLDTVEHEYRRFEVYKQANRLFLEPCEEGGLFAIRCGNSFCDYSKPGAAKKKAADYLWKLRIWAKRAYKDFVESEQQLISQEKKILLGPPTTGSDAHRAKQPNVIGGYSTQHQVATYPKNLFKELFPRCPNED
jgi:RHS repeat-associated protein